MHRVLLVGRHAAMADFLDDLGRDSSHGLEVVGVCYVDRDLGLGAVGRADFGGLGDIARAVEITNADTVAVLASPETSGSTLRKIAWDLDKCDAELVVAPGLVEVAGPRLTIRPVSGLPLLHLDRPELSGGRRLLKACFDRSVALIALVLLLPVLISLTLVIRAGGGGRGPLPPDEGGRAWQAVHTLQAPDHVRRRRRPSR